MKKIYIFTAIFALIASVGFVAPSFALAQYYNTYNNGSYVVAPIPYVNNGACINLTTSLYRGSRDTNTGGQVTALQSFLISQGYLRVASTGQFGILTYQALVQYQSAHGLVPNGAADVATRDSIRMISCGGNYGYNNNYNYGYQNGYNNYNNYYYAAPVLSYLSTNSANVGSSVTIYGSGFDLYNNTVNFNGTVLSGLPSYQGTALAFTVPQIYNNYYNNGYNTTYNTTGTYSVSVTTSHGTSNSLQFTVTGNNYCYNNNYNYGYNYNNYHYNNCYNNGSNYNQPYLSSISPSSGRVGTQVVLYGSGFVTYGNNTVHFGNGGTMNLSSNNGTTIYYTIPSYISGCDITTSNYGTACPLYAQQVTPGTYPIYVSNGNGQTSTIYFTVTY